MSQSPPQKKPMPRDFDELDFSIDEEGWNEYNLGDGARIRGRVFLTKIIRNPNDPKDMEFSFSTPTWVVFAPAHMRGDPTPMDAEETKVAAKYEVRVITNNEPWNKYRILRTGQKVKIKLTIDEVQRYVDKFDKSSNPIYSVPHGLAIHFSEPETKAQGQ